jgi:hypothetical protein
MAKRKSRIARMDALARKIVNLRDVTCQCPECEGEGYALECAHIIIRRFYVCRWNLLNLILLCKKCHAKFDANPVWGMRWFNEKFPARAEVIADLKILRNSPEERTKTWYDSDLEEIEDGLKEKLSELI